MPSEATAAVRVRGAAQAPVAAAAAPPSCPARPRPLLRHPVPPDGALWFTEPSGFPNGIGRVTTAGVFAEQNGNQIGRIATSGHITEFGPFDPAIAPDRIATGPDGNLWFAEPFNNRYYRE